MSSTKGFSSYRRRAVRRSAQGLVEDAEEDIEGVLVHIVHACEALDDEEHVRAVLRQLAVDLALQERENTPSCFERSFPTFVLSLSW